MYGKQTFLSFLRSDMSLGVLTMTSEVVGLCSELLTSLSYYIHLAYGNSFELSQESNLGPFDCELLPYC